jgi:hypothetical protein
MTVSRSSKDAGGALRWTHWTPIAPCRAPQWRYWWKGLRSLPVVFVDKATEAVVAHDRPSGSCEAEWWSALGYSKVEAAVGSLPVVVIEVGLQHRLEVTLADYKIRSRHSVRTVRTKRSA